MTEPIEITAIEETDAETEDLITSYDPASKQASEEEQIFSGSLGPSAAIAARLAKKPDISWLEPAVAELEDGTKVALFAPGDRLVIERYSTYLAGKPWLDTQTYVVLEMDDETGALRLYNPELKQFAAGNFLTGPTKGDTYCLAPKRGSVGGKKRGRPRKNPIPQEKPVSTGAGEKKRGRGRPPGSKNRPKDVIAKEKAELQKQRREKAAKKQVRKVKR